MSYTSAQLKDFYSKIHLGLAPSTSANTTLDALASQSASGAITDAQARLAVVETADADTAVAIASYQYFTAKSPSQAGLSYLVNSTTNPTDLNDAYYAQFDQTNRYINFAQNLGLLGEGAAFFQAAYGGMTFAQAVSTFYESIVGATQATAAGLNPTAAIADITSRQSYFTAVAAERFSGVNQDLAIKAALVGYIMSEAMKADVGKFAVATENMLLAIGTDTATYNVDILTTYGAGAPIVPTPPANGSFPTSPPAASSNTLVDLSGGGVALTGLAANPGATIQVGNPVNALTMTLADNSGASDVVSVVLSTSAAAAGGILFGVTAKLTAVGIESLNVTSSGALSGGGVTNILNLDPAVDTFSRIDVFGSAPLTVNLGAYTVSTTLNGGGATGELQLIASGVTNAAVGVNINGGSANDTIAPVALAGAGSVNILLYGGGGGDVFNLGAGHTEHDTLVYRGGGESTFDPTNVAGASGTSTPNTGTMDVVNGFVSGRDKLDVSVFNFNGGQAQLIDKGTVADVTALAALATTATFYQDGGSVTRSFVQVHIGADDYLFVDTNKDGIYNSTDLVVKFVGLAALVGGDIQH